MVIKQISKANLTAYMKHIIDRTYYDYWDIDEIEHPMADHVVSITYRIFDHDRPAESMMAGFHRWTRKMIRNLTIEHGDRNWVYARQPVGLYAMDYEGSRSGRLTDARVGPHVHALWVLHPDLKASVEHQLTIKQIEHATFKRLKPNEAHLNHQELNPCYKFWWKHYDKKRTLLSLVDYNLKGCMHAEGFHEGRDDQWMIIRPDPSKPIPVKTDLTLPDVRLVKPNAVRNVAAAFI